MENTEAWTAKTVSRLNAEPPIPAPLRVIAAPAEVWPTTGKMYLRRDNLGSTIGPKCKKYSDRRNNSLQFSAAIAKTPRVGGGRLLVARRRAFEQLPQTGGGTELQRAWVSVGLLDDPISQDHPS